MRQSARSLLTVGAGVAGVLLMGAAQVPPLPVTPAHPSAPYLQKMTLSGGDPRLNGEFETCVAPLAVMKEVTSRPRPATSPRIGCSHVHEIRPDGAAHLETVCDRAKGAPTSYRVTTDGTPGDMRTHSEWFNRDDATGAAKTTVRDSHVVRLGPCPAELKPGQVRRVGGPILASGDAMRLVEEAHGLAP